jgi:cystathionine gamma-synthase
MECHTAQPSPDEILRRAPRWRPADLGEPLPPSPHATSMCLPEWQDVVDYEEKRPRVMQKLQAGYPRFVVPPAAARFFEVCRARFARAGEKCHVYPSARAADRCAERIRHWSGQPARVAPWPELHVWAVCFPVEVEESALKYWRHTGDGISSRRADALLRGAAEADARDARRLVRERIAGWIGVPAASVRLFASGMAAIYTVYRALQRLRPGRPSVQFGFPYVDTLKIQQEFGAAAEFLPFGDAGDVERLRAWLARGTISGLFCEFPSNPLLISPDLRALDALAREHGFPVVVDDTLASWANVDLRPVTDVWVTSLTKYFSGRGDVMAGAVVLNPDRPLAAELEAALDAEYEESLWGDDAVALEAYSRDFEPRMARINATAARLTAWLREQPSVADVYYPAFHARENYDAFRRPAGGYGGLFSLLLKDAAATTPAFFNRLEISKGPNLGTTFTLGCPFTMLAHYSELDWAERCGVSRWLVRLSVGLEDADDLIARFARALPR